MKELSIEEKAKRYNEAIERAESIYNEIAIPSATTKGICTYIFPELKESEDERIRKSLLEYLHTLPNHYTHSGVCVPEWIAWLEKQVPVRLSHDDEIMIRQLTEYFTTGKGLQNTNDTVVEWLEDVKRKLEKQGGQDNNEDEAILYRFSFYSYKDEPNILYLAGLYVNDKYRNKGIGTKILEVVDEVAKSLNCHVIRLKTKKGGNAERLYRTHGYNSLVTEERDEIWLEKKGKQKSIDDLTQQEAMDIAVAKCFEQGEQKLADNVEPKFKVGDWVVYNDNGCICQIKSIREDDYCLWPLDSDVEGYLKITDIDNEYHLWTIQDAKDGDILVTMDDERPFIYKGCLDSNHPDSPVAYCGINSQGYFQIGGGIWWTDRNVQPATKEQRDILLKVMADAGYTFDFEKKELKKIEDEPKNYKHQVMSEMTDLVKDYIKQKPAEWSEEDETTITNIIIMLKEGASLHFNKKDMLKGVNWLNSLRDRYTWKPSDEQMEQLGKYCPDNTALTTLYEYLKHL